MSIPPTQPSSTKPTSVNNAQQLNPVQSILTKCVNNYEGKTSNKSLRNHNVELDVTNSHANGTEEAKSNKKNTIPDCAINSLAQYLSSGLSGGIKGFFQQLIAWLTNPGDWETALLIAAINNLQNTETQGVADIIVSNPNLSRAIMGDDNLSVAISNVILNNPNLAKSLSEQQKQGLLNAFRWKKYDDSTQAKLAMALFNPDEWEKSQSSKHGPSALIECNDLFLTRNIDDSGLSNNDGAANLDKSITHTLFENLNTENDEEFNKFYENFQKTLLFKDVIGREGLEKITFGGKVWVRKNSPDSGTAELTNKERTKDLLKTIYEFCNQDAKTACEFLPNFIKQFHASANCFGEVNIRLTKRYENMIASTVTTVFYNFRHSVTIDENWNMYSSVQAYMNPQNKTDTNNINGLAQLGYQFTDETYGIISVETKVDLSKEVNKDDVAKDMQSSAYIRFGKFNHPTF